MQLNCDKCVNHAESIFNVLNEEERQILAKNYICREVKKGEIIFTEGDTPTGLIRLSKGLVKVFNVGVSGREQIVRLAKPIGFIGYRALFAGENYKSNALALEDTLICVFEKKSVFKVMKSNWKFTNEIIKSLAKELGQAFSRTVTLTQKHLRGRLAEALLFLKDTYGCEDDEKTLDIHLSREDLAHMANMTTSNAIRTLTKFAEEGVILLKGRNIQLLNCADLKKISELG